MTVSFVPGGWTAYALSDVVALADCADVDVAFMSRCTADTAVPAIAATTQGWTDGAIVAFDRDADVLDVALIGRAAVAVTASDGERRLEGAAEWEFHSVSGPERVALMSAADPAPLDLPYRVGGGVVPAAAVSWRLAAPTRATEDPFDELFGHTVARSVEDAAVRTTGADRRAVQGPLGVLVFSTGERVIVESTMVLGRNPTVLDEPSNGDRVRLVKVASPGVSRQHAAIRVDRWQATIEDLGSSNGTRIASPGRSATQLAPGLPAELVTGAVVDLGGDVSFVVEEIA